MLHAGLDLSRRKLDICLLSDQGEHLDQLVVPPDAGSLKTLAGRIEEVHGDAVCAVIESMTGARIVHDTLEACGWDVEIADAQKVKGLAPLACKTDRIDSKVLATLSWRDLVPAIWLPDPRVREERELARFRLHLVKHRSMLKNRIHSTLINFGRPCPVTDLFGVEGRKLLARLDVPDPWRGNVAASVALIDDLGDQIADANARLRAGHANHSPRFRFATRRNTTRARLTSSHSRGNPAGRVSAHATRPDRSGGLWLLACPALLRPFPRLGGVGIGVEVVRGAGRKPIREPRLAWLESEQTFGTFRGCCNKRHKEEV